MAKARIVANPPTDADFLRQAQGLAQAADTPQDLELALRQDYPQARVVRGVTDVIERWYAYRDGSWTRTEGN